MYRLKIKPFIIIIFIVFLLFTVALIFYPIFKIDSLIREGFASEIANDGSNFAGYLNNRDSKITYNLNPIEQQVHLVYFRYESNEGTISNRVNIYRIKRDSILDWSSPVLLNQIDINNKSFSEAVEIAKKYDLTKENPDPKNITVYAPPAQEEINSLKKAEELNNNPEYRELMDKCDVYFPLGSQEKQDCFQSVGRQFGKE